MRWGPWAPRRGGEGLRTAICGFFCSALAFVLLAAIGSEVSADDYMIVPGERIGDVSLNMPIEEILKMLGTPSRVDPGTGLYQWQGRQITVYQSLSTGRISSVRTYWVFRRTNSYRTDRGIAIGATVEQVRQAYSDAGCFLGDGANWRTYGWRPLGVFFTIWTFPDLPVEMINKIAEIGVQRPTTAPPGPGLRACWQGSP